MPASFSKSLFNSCLLFFLFSCSSKPDETISAMQNSLEESIKRINTSSLQILQSLIDKKSDPLTRIKAEIWSAKASAIASITISFYNELDYLKKKKDIDTNDLNH